MTEEIQNRFYILTDPATDEWTDITGDVLIRNCSWTKGIMSAAPLDRVARVGSLTMLLRNYEEGTKQAFRYTPGHPNCIAGFGVKCQVKVVSVWNTYPTTKCQWKGWIHPEGIIQPSGSLSAQLVQVQAFDWMYFALNSPITLEAIQTNKTFGEAVIYLASLLEVQPSRIDDHDMHEIFPSVFDTVRSKTKVYAEMLKLALSELGYAYITYEPNSVTEDILRVEGRDYRTSLALNNNYLLLTADSPPINTDLNENILVEGSAYYLVADTMTTFENPDGIKDFKIVNGAYFTNRVIGKCYPRKVAGAPVVLFTLDKPIWITAGETISNLRITYVNPGSNYPDIAATSVSVTDFQMWANEDRTGTDHSADLTVTGVFGASDGDLSVENTGVFNAWITDIEVSGTPIYLSNPVSQVVEIATGTDPLYGKIELTLDQKYQDDPTSSFDQISLLATRYSQRTNSIEYLSFIANKSFLSAFLFTHIDVGHKLTIVDSQGLVNENYIIQGIETKSRGPVSEVKWWLKPVRYDTYIFWEIGVAGRSELGTTSILGFE